MIDPQLAREALRSVIDPDIGRNIVELGMVRDLAVAADGQVSFTLALTIPTCPLKDQIAFNAEQALKAQSGVSAVHIRFDVLPEAERRAILAQTSGSLPRLNTFNRIQRVVAVMSGKGGVGKSALTALLAVGLARAGNKVGILDADLTGPSIPRLFNLPPGGLRGGPQGILPAITPGGVRVVSTNLMLPEEDSAAMLRGPLVAATIQQFWGEVLWGRLDYLLVDLPPGTSDAPLTVIRSLPLNGALLVTAPQALAALVVRKGVHMLQSLNIPILGVVENFSSYRCPDCGAEHSLFGESHAAEVAALAEAPLLARLPLDPRLTALCDAGQIEQADTAQLAAVLERLAALPAVQSAPRG